MKNSINAILNLDKTAIKLTEKRLKAGEDPLKLLEDLRIIANMIGEKYKKGEFFVSDLVYAGEIVKEISEIVRPKLSGMGKRER